MNMGLFQQVLLKNKLMKKTIMVTLHNYKMITQNQLNFLKLDKVKKLISFNIYSRLLGMLGLKMVQRERDIMNISLRLSLNHSHNLKNKKKKNPNKSKKKMNQRRLKSNQLLKRQRLLQQKRMKHQIQLLKLNLNNKHLLLNLVKLVNLKNRKNQKNINQRKLNLAKHLNQQNLIQNQSNQFQSNQPQFQSQFHNQLKLHLMTI